MDQGEKLELRKVQLTGGSSYVITLPKDWIIDQKIQKNDPLGLIVQPDGSLLISTKLTPEKVHREKVIDADAILDPRYLFRLLIGAYIAGYSYIIVKSKKGLSPTVRDQVAEFTRMTIGPEIMEEDLNSTTLKDLLDPAEMPFNKTVERMFILVKTMHENTMKALRSGDGDLAEEVIMRDDDVDKLHWLIARQSNIMLHDTNLARRLDVSLDDAIYYFLVSRILERIGDHAVIISKNQQILIDNEVGSAMVKKVVKAHKVASQIFSDSMNAWMRKDIAAANDTITAMAELANLCETIISSSIRSKGQASAAEGRIAESIRRTGEYSADISELVINNLISKV